jgi:CBS domain-containing protein
MGQISNSGEAPVIRRVMPDVVSDQDLLTLPQSATVLEAAVKMSEHKVRSTLVVTGERLEGIFTGTDLIDRVVAKGLNPSDTELRAVMTANPVTLSPGSLAIDALRMMHESGFRHLPICEGERLLGIVSRRDFMADEEEEIEREDRLWEKL